MKKYLIPLVMMALVMVAMAGVPAFAEEVIPAAPASGMVDLTPFIQVAITLLASLITIKVVPWIKARTSTAQQEALCLVTRTLVYAAEQIYGSKTGKQKKQYVQDSLLERGYKVDIDVIEAAVKELSLDEPFEVAQEYVVEIGEDEKGLESSDDLT